jgi:hypothetical protein
MERRQVDLGLVEILEAVRQGERRAQIRSRVKPKREQRRSTPRPGRRERAARKGRR